MQPGFLGNADAVFGADRAAEVGDELEHGGIGAVIVGGDAEDVDVEIAIARMAEEDGPGPGMESSEAAAHLAFKGRELRAGKGDIELVGDAFGGDGLGVALPVGPEAVPTGAVGGEQDGIRVGEGGEGGGERGRGVGGAGAFDEQIAGPWGREGWREPGVAADELEAFGEEDLRGFEAGDGGPDGADDLEGGGEAGEAEEGDRAEGALGHQAEAGAGDNRERALAAGEEAREIVAGVVLEEPGQAADDGSVGEDSLDANEVVAHGAEADDADAPGVGGDHAADGGAGTGSEVDSDIPAVWTHGVLQLLEGDAGADGHLTGDGVQVLDGVEAAEAEHEFSAPGHAAANEAGVASLGHHGEACLAAEAEDGRDLLGSGGSGDGGCRGREAAGPVGLEGGAGVGVLEQVRRADDGAEAFAERGVHAGSLPRGAPISGSVGGCRGRGCGRGGTSGSRRSVARAIRGFRGRRPG